MAQAATETGQAPFEAEEHVELHLPVHPELWVLARMSASAIASRLDFGVDAVDDLRLAIDELCNSCAAGATADSRLHLDYRWDGDSIHVACSVSKVEAASANEGDILELSTLILDSLVEEHHIAPVSSGMRTGWLTKRRAATS